MRIPLLTNTYIDGRLQQLSDAVEKLTARELPFVLN